VTSPDDNPFNDHDRTGVLFHSTRKRVRNADGKTEKSINPMHRRSDGLNRDAIRQWELSATATVGTQRDSRADLNRSTPCHERLLFFRLQQYSAFPLFSRWLMKRAPSRARWSTARLMRYKSPLLNSGNMTIGGIDTIAATTKGRLSAHERFVRRRAASHHSSRMTNLTNSF